MSKGKTLSGLLITAHADDYSCCIHFESARPMPGMQTLESPQKCILEVKVAAKGFVVWISLGFTSRGWLQSAHIIIVCEECL